MNLDANKLTAVILSAGASSRMGYPKALLPWDGAPIILELIAAFEAVGAEVIVVLGGQHAEVEKILPTSVTIRHNQRWKTTDMAASLSIGLDGVSGPVLVTPVDVPPPPASVLRSLTAQKTPCVPTHNGVDGHPIWADAESIKMGLKAQPLNQLLSAAPRLSFNWPGCTKTWNTRAQWLIHSQFED